MSDTKLYTYLCKVTLISSYYKPSIKFRNKKKSLRYELQNFLCDLH